MFALEYSTGASLMKNLSNEPRGCCKRFRAIAHETFAFTLS